MTVVMLAGQLMGATPNLEAVVEVEDALVQAVKLEMVEVLYSAQAEEAVAEKVPLVPLAVTVEHGVLMPQV